MSTLNYEINTFYNLFRISITLLHRTCKKIEYNIFHILSSF
jgi:hypothetical protein